MVIPVDDSMRPKIEALKSLPSRFRVVAIPSRVEAMYPVIMRWGRGLPSLADSSSTRAIHCFSFKVDSSQ